MNRATGVLLLFAAGAIGGGGFFYQDLLNKRGELDGLRAEVAASRQKADTLRERKDAIRSEYDMLREGIENLESLTRSKGALESEVATKEKDLDAAGLELVALVREVRRLAAGMTLPELRLAAGQVFKSVRIQSVKDSEMVASHDSGIARIAMRRLPEELKKRFRDDVVVESETKSDSPAVAGVAPAPAPGSASAPAKKPSTTTSRYRSLPPPATRAVAEARLSGMMRLLVTLQERLAAKMLAQQNNSVAPAFPAVREVDPKVDPERRAKQIALEDKRRTDLENLAIEQATKRAEDIEDLKGKIAELQAEIASFKMGESFEGGGVE